MQIDRLQFAVNVDFLSLPNLFCSLNKDSRSFPETHLQFKHFTAWQTETFPHSDNLRRPGFHFFCVARVQQLMGARLFQGSC